MLEKILPEYLDHIISTQNTSMLARIYGLFTIKTNYFAPLEVMVMQNTYQSTKKSDCVLKFDLKGSTIARNVRNITSDPAQAKLRRAKCELDFW